MDPDYSTRFDTEILDHTLEDALRRGWAPPTSDDGLGPISAEGPADREESAREMARLGVAWVDPSGSVDDRDSADASDPELWISDIEVGAEPVPGYRLLSRIGVGGSAEVWMALGPGGVPLAMKFLRGGGGTEFTEPISPRSSSKARRDGLRSLELMREVRHANLLPLFGAWQCRGQLVVGMELAEGTLMGRIQEAIRSGLPGVPLPELLEYMGQAARGIDYLNEPRHSLMGRERVGIQHRDIKPQNLLLVGGCLKVADFGLARLLEESITTTSSLTPAYAAPEFFGGKPSSRSDQYSLAVTYCQARGGRLPFVGDRWAVMLGHCQGHPDLSMLPAAERPAVARALAKSPEDRWPDCRTFVAHLDGTPPASTATPPAAPHAGRRGVDLGLLACVGFLLAAWFATRPLAPGPRRPRPTVVGQRRTADPVRVARAIQGQPAEVRDPATVPAPAVPTGPPEVAARAKPDPVDTAPTPWAKRLVDQLRSARVPEWLIEASRKAPARAPLAGETPEPPAPRPALLAEAEPALPPIPRTATIRVLLPEARAELVVRGEVGRGNPDEWYGARRSIHTPPFTGGADYLVGAFWTDPKGGGRLTRSRKLRAEPGRTYEVDLRANPPTCIELKRPSARGEL